MSLWLEPKKAANSKLSKFSSSSYGLLITFFTTIEVIRVFFLEASCASSEYRYRTIKTFAIIEKIPPKIVLKVGLPLKVN